jgi:uncharacterized membrane-anchored protein YjiN (DUF445 family)
MHDPLDPDQPPPRTPLKDDPFFGESGFYGSADAFTSDDEIPPAVEVDEVAPVRHLPALTSEEATRRIKDSTKRSAKDVAKLLLRTAKRHLPVRAPKAGGPPPSPPKMVGRHATLLPWLKAIPVALWVLFALSFVIDFAAGWTFDFLGETHAVGGLVRTLAVSGLIGFLTNWLAITMLFQPREKRPILGQGLIPAQRDRVVFRLAQAISQELINEQIIKEKIEESGVIGRYRDVATGVVRGVLEDDDFRAELKALAADYTQDVLGSDEMRKRLTALAVEKVEQQAGTGLGGLALRVYRSFREDDFQARVDRAISEIPAALDPVLDKLDEMLDRLPEEFDRHADDLEEAATKAVLGFVEGLDVYEMIVQNASRFDEAQLERLLKATSNEQLNYIKYLGGLLGVLGGLVIWQPLLSMAVFAGIIGAVWALDTWLYNRQNRERA